MLMLGIELLYIVKDSGYQVKPECAYCLLVVMLGLGMHKSMMAMHAPLTKG